MSEGAGYTLTVVFPSTPWASISEKLTVRYCTDVAVHGMIGGVRGGARVVGTRGMGVRAGGAFLGGPPWYGSGCPNSPLFGHISHCLAIIPTVWPYFPLFGPVSQCLAQYPNVWPSIPTAGLNDTTAGLNDTTAGLTGANTGLPGANTGLPGANTGLPGSKVSAVCGFVVTASVGSRR